MDNSKLKIKNSKFALRAFTLVDPGFPDRSPGQALSGVTSLHKGFTLVELMIVVAILGILAAIVMPEFQGHIQLAKEAAAKDNLRMLREAIERYAADHNGVPPGYTDNDKSFLPSGFVVKLQLEDGYLSEIPENPFNGIAAVYAYHMNYGIEFSPDDSKGWYYDPENKDIRLSKTGTDSEGKAYWSY